MIYTKNNLDVAQIKDKAYLQELLAVGKELDDHYTSREGVMNFDNLECVKKYKEYDKERKEIDKKCEKAYKEYVNYIQSILKPEGMSTDQSSKIWNYSEKVNIGETLQEVVNTYMDICELV